MPRSVDQEALPESVSDEQLLVAIERRDTDVGSRVRALKEVGRRRSEGRRDVVGRIAADPREPEALRTAAVVELGRLSGPGTRDALVAALRSGQPGVARRAAEALGRTGDREALKALESVRLPDGPARRSAAFARSLLAYRLGLNAHRLQRPSGDAVLEVDPPRTAGIQVEVPDSDALEEAMEALQRELPGTALSRDGAVSLVCGDDEYLVVLSPDLQQDANLQRLQRTSALSAVVLKRSASLDRFFVYEYLLTHPEGSNTLALFGVRTTGDMTHFGEVRVGDRGATFSLRATATPYSPPLDLAGTFDEARRMTFERATLQRQFDRARQRVRHPRKVDVP